MATDLTPEIARLRRIMGFDTEPFLLNRETLGALLDAAERCAAAEAQAKAAGELLRAAKEFVADDAWREDGAALIYLENLKAAIEAAERAGVKP